MAYYVGDIFIDRLTLVDGASAPINDAELLITAIYAEKPSGADFTADIAVAEVGDTGVYEITWPAFDETGDWSAVYKYAGTTDRFFNSPIIRVDETAATTVGTTVATTTGNTRKQIRRDVLHDLGDLRILVATADGSDVTLVDAINLYGEVNAYAGREIRFTGGTTDNLGEIRYVNSSSATQRAVGWGYALPADTALGDEAELVNTDGIGFRSEDVDRSINRVLRDLQASRTFFPVADEELTYTRGEGMDIPARMSRVEGVYYQTADGVETNTWHQVARAWRPETHGWWVDRPSREVRIGGRWAVAVDTATVRIVGVGVPAELDEDDDETAVDHSFMVMATQAQLARSRHMRRATPESERLMYGLQQEAKVLLKQAVTPPGPFACEV